MRASWTKLSGVRVQRRELWVVQRWFTQKRVHQTGKRELPASTPNDNLYKYSNGWRREKRDVVGVLRQIFERTTGYGCTRSEQHGRKQQCGYRERKRILRAAGKLQELYITRVLFLVRVEKNMRGSLQRVNDRPLLPQKGISIQGSMHIPK